MKHRMLFWFIASNVIEYNCLIDDIGCTESKQCPVLQISGRAITDLT